MNSDRKSLFILTISLTILLLGILFIPASIARYILAITLLVFSILFVFLIKKRKIFSIYKNQVLYILIGAGIVYITLYFLTGINFGFNKLNGLDLLKEIIPLIICIISIEIVRNITLSQENKLANIICFIGFVVADVVLFSKINKINNFNQFMDLLGLILLPSIMSNVLYHNISNNYGYYPNIVYRLILSLYTLIIPFVPKTPDSLISMLNMIYPLVLVGLVNILYQKKEKKAINKSSKVTPVIVGSVIVLVMSFALLISNQFKYGALVIATESMTGEINKGDMIVFKKLDNNDEVKENSIIVFTKDDNLIVHRVVGIENIDNEIRYYTKGDANESNDYGYITRDNIVGITKFKMSYMGYPTLWLRDLFE